jgi:hypothetical protein
VASVSGRTFALTSNCVDASGLLADWACPSMSGSDDPRPLRNGGLQCQQSRPVSYSRLRARAGLARRPRVWQSAHRRLSGRQCLSADDRPGSCSGARCRQSKGCCAAQTGTSRPADWCAHFSGQPQRSDDRLWTARSGFSRPSASQLGCFNGPDFETKTEACAHSGTGPNELGLDLSHWLGVAAMPPSLPAPPPTAARWR